MDDVNNPITTESAPQADVTEAPVTPEPQETKPPEVESAEKAAPSQPEKTVPYGALREERARRQELQREIAELKARGTQQREVAPYSQDEEFDRVMNHPFVQNLMLQQAKRELTDYAKDTLDKYQGLPDSVKKAIIKNPRGFVQETTTDIENAKLDLLEYIEGLVEGMNAQPTPQQAKAFAVAATNAPPTQAAGTPADVAKILEKPMDELTDADMKIVDEYKKSQPKK